MPRLTLTRYEPYPVTFAEATGWALRVTVVAEPEDFDARIFLHRRHPEDPATGEEKAEFECVCGPYDYTTWPADRPSDERPYNFFRTDTFTIILPRPDLANAAWEYVVGEADNLLNGLAALALMRPVDTAEVGTLPASDSESASDSDSASA